MVLIHCEKACAGRAAGPDVLIAKRIRSRNRKQCTTHRKAARPTCGLPTARNRVTTRTYSLDIELVDARRKFAHLAADFHNQESMRDATIMIILEKMVPGGATFTKRHRRTTTARIPVINAYLRAIRSRASERASSSDLNLVIICKAPTKLLRCTEALS